MDFEYNATDNKFGYQLVFDFDWSFIGDDNYYYLDPNPVDYSKINKYKYEFDIEGD